MIESILERVAGIDSVSIPLWFDWNQTTRQQLGLRDETSQFHYGSIEIKEYLNLDCNGNIKSQFHYGSIEIQITHAYTVVHYVKSQFHYGSIEIRSGGHRHSS